MERLQPPHLGMQHNRGAQGLGRLNALRREESEEMVCDA